MDTAPDQPATAADAPRVRSTPRPGDQPCGISRHTPSALAISERQRADRWKAIALCVSVGSLILAGLAIHAGRATERVFVLDPAGNVFAGPLEPLGESKRFFNTTTLYAANAALQRSSAGFDLPELLKLYFLPRAIAKLEDDQKAREPDMRRRNLQWKPMIDSMSDPVAAGERRMVEVRGRIIAAGAFANRSFYEEPAFVLVLGLVRNPDLGKSGAYPWVCDDIDLRVLPVERRPR